MSVTMTANVRDTKISAYETILNVSLKAVGDGSAGNISYNAAIPYQFDGRDLIWLTNMSLYQDDAAAQVVSNYLLNAEWSALHPGTTGFVTWLFGIAANGWIGNGADFLSNPQFCPTYTRPLLLGNPLVVSPTMYITFNTNTNAKNYQAFYNLRVIKYRG